ncbi:37s ribosomal s5 protein [Rutstroemia sp. NJR-2017a BBW]|nr:37s ribosomal s5 protein [Rutstroemia sp. NJR-2017a BBW]PQE08721.1 37s ribosomal s5 protein [Rutstroemia sp. NJR-2017a BBW]
MAWDSKPIPHRQNSSSKAKQPQSQNASQNPSFQPKSTHTADSALQPFLNPSFDPADYLNSTLPALQSSNSSQNAKNNVPLAELSTQTQTLLSHLSAHTTRLTTTLTQLTDEILRSGSRLAYEVEVLRGETLGLSEALTEGLHDDVVKFVPAGLEGELARKPPTARESVSTNTNKVADPPYIAELRTLTLVRSRLDTVIKTFGDAMSWTFPPSEVSVTSSFLSVSAPEPGSDAHSTEEKGQQVSKQLREEIAGLLAADDPINGIEAAAKRVEELKELALVWKGTAEERARNKFVEGLAKMVEDRHRELLKDVGQDSQVGQTAEAAHDEPSSLFGMDDGRTQGAFGFINQLQRLRGAS